MLRHIGSRKESCSKRVETHSELKVFILIHKSRTWQLYYARPRVTNMAMAAVMTWLRSLGQLNLYGEEAELEAELHCRWMRHIIPGRCQDGYGEQS
jgi:hypothetical protein